MAYRTTTSTVIGHLPDGGFIESVVDASGPDLLHVYRLVTPDAVREFATLRELMTFVGLEHSHDAA